MRWFIWMIMLPATLFLLVSESFACHGPQSETFLFFPEEPKESRSDYFIGQIEIVGDEDILRGAPRSHFSAKVLESRSHNELVGRSIDIIVTQHSCGPYLDTPDRWDRIDGTVSIQSKRKGWMLGKLTKGRQGYALHPFEVRFTSDRKLQVIDPESRQLLAP